MTQAEIISRMFSDDGRMEQRNGVTIREICSAFAAHKWLAKGDTEIVYKFKDGSRIIIGINEWRVE